MQRRLQTLALPVLIAGSVQDTAIIGCEVYVATGSRFEKKTTGGRDVYNHLVDKFFQWSVCKVWNWSSALR